MIDWKRKLTSRKFWMAVAGFVTSILVMFKVDGEISTQITTAIMGFGCVIAYIFAEGWTDGKSVTAKDEAKDGEEEDADSNDISISG